MITENTIRQYEGLVGIARSGNKKGEIKEYDGFYISISYYDEKMNELVADFSIVEKTYNKAIEKIVKVLESRGFKFKEVLFNDTTTILL